jgi:hypothetical protein
MATVELPAGAQAASAAVELERQALAVFVEAVVGGNRMPSRLRGEVA